MLDAYSAVTAARVERAQWPPELVNHPDPLQLVKTRGGVAMDAMRAALGADPLTEQSLEWIGRRRF